MNKKFVSILPALLLIVGAVAQDVSPQHSGGISGVVRSPDGTPKQGATVTATTDCKEMGYNLVQEVRSSSDGSFYVPFFAQASCNMVRLRAAKVEDLWLKTGDDVFYERHNGTAPTVEASRSGSPARTEITLGQRGALVSLRVRDAATQKFIWAGLSVDRLPVPGAKFGSMYIATGRDGSEDALLLPSGQYEICVQQYSCNGIDYLVADRVCDTVAVEGGQRIAKEMLVDVRLLRAVKVFGNMHNTPCAP